MCRRLAGVERGSDDALELARHGLALTRLPRPPRVAAFDGLLAEVLDAWAGKVAAYAAKGSTLDDADAVYGEAQVWVWQALCEFVPTDDGGTVAVYVRSRLPWFRSTMRRSASDGLRTRGRFVVAGTAAAVRDRFLTEEHREPTLDELKAATTAMVTAQTRDKVLDAANSVGRPISDEELDADVRARMSKDGLLAALDEFADVWIEAAGPLRFDPLPDDDRDGVAASWSVPPPAVDLADAAAADTAEAVYEKLLRVALGDQLWARRALSARAGDVPSGADADDGAHTLRELAADGAVSIGELRDVLDDARVRVAAPHAQWAHLSPQVVIVDR